MFELLHSLSIDTDAGVATGWADLPADHPWFADHFPDHPTLPGTIAVELAAQVAGPLAEDVIALRHRLARYAVLGMIRDIKFLQPVPLPAQLEIEARIRRCDPSNVRSRVTARVDGLPVMRGELVMAMLDITPGWEAAIEQRRTRVDGWKRSAEQNLVRASR